jgi:pimeloyl-ACP methyl ester carboxylesterase
MSEYPEQDGQPPADSGSPAADEQRTADEQPDPEFTDRRRSRRFLRALRWPALALLVILVALTTASFGYNLTAGGPPARPGGLLMAPGGGFDTRYLEWGTTGTPVVLVPGAFETADTFDALGAVLGATHRVYAIDLTGTGYSAPSPPYSATHEAAQLLAFLAAKGLTGPNAALLVGHSAGAAVVGLAAVTGGTRYARGVVFLDGDATPLGGPAFLGSLLIDPYRASLLRLALSQDLLIRKIYDSQCGPSCPALDAGGVQTWRQPLQQPGFAGELAYTLRHGIASMTTGEFAELRNVPLPKLVIYGAHDPQMPAADAMATAQRIGAPPPVTVPGRHLTMISSPAQVAAALRGLLAGLAPSWPGSAGALSERLRRRAGDDPDKAPSVIRYIAIDL